MAGGGGGGGLMRGIRIPLHDFAPKMQGLMPEGGAYLRDTTVLLQPVTQQRHHHRELQNH